MEYYTFPEYIPDEDLGDMLQFGLDNTGLEDLGEDLNSDNIEELLNPIPVASTSTPDPDPVKNTIIHIQSFWHLQQVKEIKLGEILVLGFQYPQPALVDHLIRLDAENLPHTTIICRNPTIQTIYNIPQLQALTHVSLNSFLYLELGHSKHVDKILHELEVTNLNQNIFARVNKVEIGRAHV